MFAVANPWIDAAPSILTNGANKEGRNRARVKKNGDETRAQNVHCLLGVEDDIGGTLVPVRDMNRD